MRIRFLIFLAESTPFFQCWSVEITASARKKTKSPRSYAILPRATGHLPDRTVGDGGKGVSGLACVEYGERLKPLAPSRSVPSRSPQPSW
jgi:hypothetical protein